VRKFSAIVMCMLGVSGFFNLAHADEYKIDPSHTAVFFGIGHNGLSTTVGFFKELEGTIVFNQDAPDTSSVEAYVYTDTVDTNNVPRDDFVKTTISEEEASFISSSVKVTGPNSGEIVGTLTIRSIPIPFRFDVTEFQQKGNGLGFSAVGSLSRSEHGITTSYDQGIGDKVKIWLEVEAIKK
jgi:polyisoprenoid-binding protein YceI